MDRLATRADRHSQWQHAAAGRFGLWRRAPPATHRMLRSGTAPMMSVQLVAPGLIVMVNDTGRSRYCHEPTPVRLGPNLTGL
jgi:hypothetical protein